MDTCKSLDEHTLIAALLSDVQSLHSDVYSPRDMKLDLRKVRRRMSREGISFLTKALPRLGKAFDRALSGEISFDAVGFRKRPNSKIPKFLGSLFERVFAFDGGVLPTPCVTCIENIRQILYCFYKYELPYEQDQEQEVIAQFKRTENEILNISQQFTEWSQRIEAIQQKAARGTPLRRDTHVWLRRSLIAKARKRLHRLFAHFDPRDISPGHGPGAVSTKEKLWSKWTFRTISPRIIDSYPIDEYFYLSVGHLCDDIDGFNSIEVKESSARVCLVPKDSRGPRLISCEPLDFQWIQQGLSRAIVKHVEQHPLTRYSVHFTDQRPNQLGALLGSSSGRYATLDLKEASDRISVGLVRLLFPEPLLGALLNSRSLSTELPGGEILKLEKFAPMGSALCFPVLALTIWAVLTAAAPDADTREGILVYGDDVIVPTAFAVNAIEVLESFGLKVNRDKSFIRGSFKESCGVDAFNGVNVTPVRLRTVWSSHRCPHSYASWIAYANSFYRKKYYHTYWLLADNLLKLYGPIPEQRDPKREPLALCDVPERQRPRHYRYNSFLQRREYRIWCLVPARVYHEIDGWKMLFRYIMEGARPVSRDPGSGRADAAAHTQAVEPVEFDVRSYTKRDTIKLVKRWR